MAGRVRIGRAAERVDLAPSIVTDALREPGTALPPAIREAAARRFRFDFKRVEIHTGPTADASARAVRADAYTVGRHVVFAAGRYAPHTPEGKCLLEHELTHVVEHGAVDRPAGPLRLAPAASEHQARAVERGGAATSLRSAPAVLLQRRASGPDPADPATAEEFHSLLLAAARRTWGADQGRHTTSVLEAVITAGVAEQVRRLDPQIFEEVVRDWPNQVTWLARLGGLAPDGLAATLARTLAQRLFTPGRRDPADTRNYSLLRLVEALGRAPLADRRQALADHERVFSRDRALPILHRLPRDFPEDAPVKGILTALDRDLTNADSVYLELQYRAFRSDSESRSYDGVYAAWNRGRPTRPGVLHDEWTALISHTTGWTHADVRPASAWTTVSLESFVAHNYSAGVRDLALQHLRDLARPASTTTTVWTDEAIDQLLARIHAGGGDLGDLVKVLLLPDVHARLPAIKTRYTERFAEPPARALQRPGFGLGSTDITDARIHAIALLTTGRTTDNYALLALDLLVHRDADEVLALLGRAFDDRSGDPRAILRSLYAAAYYGIFASDAPVERPVARHLELCLGDGWRARKATILLVRPLTGADHLYFLSWGVRSPDRAALAAQLASEWARGFEHFAQLERDWLTFVTPSLNYTAPRGLTAAMRDVWRGRPPGSVRAVLDGYDAEVRERARPASERRVAPIDEARRRLTAALAVLDLADGDDELIEAAASVGEQLAHLRAGSTSEHAGAEKDAFARLEVVLARVVPAGRTERPRYGGEAQTRARLLLARGGKLSAGDELSQIGRGNLFGLSPAEATRAVALITAAWAAGTIPQLLADARTALRDPGDPRRILRPAYELADHVRIGSPIEPTERNQLVQVLRVMLDTTSPQVDVGAWRLRVELTARRRTDGDVLARTLAFLRAAQAGLQVAVIRKYVDLFAIEPAAGGYERRFALHVHSLFGPDRSAVLDLIDLAHGPPQDAVEVRARAEQRGAVRGGGTLSGLTRGILKVFDDSVDRGDSDLTLARQAAALEAQLSPAERTALVRLNGARDYADALNILHSRFLRHHDAELAARRGIADFLGTCVEVFGRSLLVAFTGPAGLAGLASALSAIIAGQLLRKGLLGAEHDIISRQLLAQLATEVSGTITQLKLEPWIKDLFEKRLATRMYATRLATAERKLASIEGDLASGLGSDQGFDRFLSLLSQQNAAKTELAALGNKAAVVRDIGKELEFATETTVKLAGEVFDRTVEQVIDTPALPGATRLIGKTLNALTHGYLSVAVKPLTDQLHAGAFLNKFSTAWVLQTVKVALVGPPPKAAGYQIVSSQTIKLLENPPQDLGKALLGLISTIAWVPATAVSVGAAFAVSRRSDAVRTRDAVSADPQRALSAARADPKRSDRAEGLLLRYEAAALAATTARRDPPDIFTFLRDVAPPASDAAASRAFDADVKQLSKVWQKLFNITP